MAGPGTEFLVSFHRYYSTQCQILENILTNLQVLIHPALYTNTDKLAQDMHQNKQ
jgi:hypothetical protein